MSKENKSAADKLKEQLGDEDLYLSQEGATTAKNVIRIQNQGAVKVQDKQTEQKEQK